MLTVLVYFFVLFSFSTDVLVTDLSFVIGSVHFYILFFVQPQNRGFSLL